MIVTGSLTTGVTWQIWNSGFDLGTGGSSASTIYTTSNGIWTEWISAATGAAISVPTVNVQIWTSWVSQGASQPQLIRSSVTVNGFDQYRRPAPLEISPEERLERDWYEALLEEDDRKFRREVMAADAKAVVLLKSVLNEEQQKTYDRSKYFYVRSRSGRMYKVRPGKIHNIIMVDPVSKEELLELCVTTENHHLYPDADVMVAQKLMLEHRENEALRKANIWDLKRNKRPLSEAEKRLLVAA